MQLPLTILQCPPPLAPKLKAANIVKHAIERHNFRCNEIATLPHIRRTVDIAKATIRPNAAEYIANKPLVTSDCIKVLVSSKPPTKSTILKNPHYIQSVVIANARHAMTYAALLFGALTRKQHKRFTVKSPKNTIREHAHAVLPNSPVPFSDRTLSEIIDSLIGMISPVDTA